MHHTGRFAVKLKAQSRSMRKASVDAPYGLEAWRMFKEMAVMLGGCSVPLCVRVCVCACDCVGGPTLIPVVLVFVCFRWAHVNDLPR